MSEDSRDNDMENETTADAVAAAIACLFGFSDPTSTEQRSDLDCDQSPHGYPPLGTYGLSHQPPPNPQLSDAYGQQSLFVEPPAAHQGEDLHPSIQYRVQPSYPQSQHVSSNQLSLGTYGLSHQPPPNPQLSDASGQRSLFVEKPPAAHQGEDLLPSIQYRVQPPYPQSQHVSSNQAGKKTHHSTQEKKRRDRIKHCYNGLRNSVPYFQGGKVKASEKQMLKRTAHYIESTQRKISAHQRDIDDLRGRNKTVEDQIRALEKAQSTGNMAAVAAIVAMIERCNNAKNKVDLGSCDTETYSEDSSDNSDDSKDGPRRK